MPKGARLSPDKKGRIVELRRAGLQNKDIAKRLEVGVNSIIRTLHEVAPELVRVDLRSTNGGTRRECYAGHEAEEYVRPWTGRDAPPVREHRQLEGSCIRPLTQKELTRRR